MVERLVDVIKKNNLVHVFPVNVDGKGTSAAAEKVKKAAVFTGLATPMEIDDLSVRDHVCRSGRFKPFGDNLNPEAGTKKSLEEATRSLAYQYWEQSGRTENQQDDNWLAAERQLVRERAYHLWEAEGRPENKANEHWHQSCSFNGC